MMVCIFRVCAVMVCFTMLAMSAFAQTATEYVLGEAVKVERRRDASLRVAMPSYSLDTLGLKRTAATDLATALRHIAGVNMRDYGGAGGLKTISVRGFGAAHTTICYDGLPMAATQNGAVDVNAFAFEQIRGIRLDVGDVSPLLAPARILSAATLFINSQYQPSHNSLKAMLQTGHWELLNPSLSFSRKLSKAWTVGGNARFYYRNNNYKFRVNNGVMSGTERRNNSRVSSTVNELWVKKDLGSNQNVSAKAYYSYSNNKLPGAVILYNNANHEAMKDALWFVQSAYRGEWNRTRVNAALKFQGQTTIYTDDDPQYPKDALRQRYRQHEYYATAGVERRINKEWSAAYVADYAYNTLSTHLATADGASRHTLQQAASLRFSNAKWSATARMGWHQAWNAAPNASGGAPLDMNKLQPSLSVAYRMDELGGTVRAFYKDYYRQPTFSENYFYHLGGTAQLRPERTRQLGGGVTWQGKVSNVLLKSTLDAYYNDVSDRITSIPYNLFVWRTENHGKVKILGADVTLQAEIPLNTNHAVIFSSNYSMQNASDISSPADINYGKQPAYMPKHSGAASLSWENPWLNINVGVTAASERWSTHNHAPQTRLPGYAEVNASIERDFILSHGVLNAGVFVNNALDKSYEVIRRYPMPLRNVMLRIGWKM